MKSSQQLSSLFLQLHTLLQSGVGLVAGLLEAGQSLRVESRMPAGGVIFSDGMETDCLPFDAGAIAEIRAAAAHAHLVTRADEP